MFEKLARGPRQRSDRLPRELKDGRTVDIYGLVLHGLAHIRPDLVSIEYEELRAASLDIFWLKDESLEDSANLPDPDVIAAEIAEDLQAALDQFTQIAADLRK